MELLGEAAEDWRVALIDTGIWRNIGERLMAVKKHVENEEFFLANYSDGLSDVNLDAMIDWFESNLEKSLAFSRSRSFQLPSSGIR